ncbi:MAG: hypothetical protein Q7U82_07890 [Gammaproteobacteria bacterium]|nr:hypothetical protein [Gammaproteobacteria bacterium]
MTSITTHNWQQALKERLPGSLRTLFQANARAQLLRQVNTVLLVHDDRLYDLSNGSWRQLNQTTDSEWSTSIAAAAVELLNHEITERSVLLLLPAAEFIATTISMPGVARENLRSALQLQTAVLLPSHNGNLLFAVNTAASHSDGTDVVLWMNENRLDALFEAFTAHGLFLASVMPRTLAAASQASDADELQIEDGDATTLTQLVFSNGVLTQWLQIDRADLEDELLRRQWLEATAAKPSAALTRQSLQSAQAWVDLARTIVANRDYSFIPAGAQAVRKQMEKGKRLVGAAIAAVVVLLLGVSPFLVQSLQARSLLADLAEQRELSATARADQAVVRDFEQRWGVLTEFPAQNISATLLQLQTVLSPSVLTSLEVDEGSVQIEGESDDPQSLLQRLEQDSMFTGVDFARATNNNRYYIDLRLSTVDFDGYRQRYFPEVRR